MAGKRIFCEHCLDDITYHIEDRELTRKLKGKDYTFKGQEAICDNCKQPVFVTEIDKANRQALYACFKTDDLSEYVQAHGLTISEFARPAMLERIEDEYDLQILHQAMAEDDGARISHREVFKEFGIKTDNEPC